MSKVVHLSRSAHERAKLFCSHRGLSMSDWVASLIEQATGNDEGGPEFPRDPSPSGGNGGSQAQASSTRLPSQRLHSAEQHTSRASGTGGTGDEESELAQIYTAPPFWARERHAATRAVDGP